MAKKKDDFSEEIDPLDDSFLDSLDDDLDSSFDDEFDLDEEPKIKKKRKPTSVDVSHVAKSMKPSMDDVAKVTQKIGTEYGGIGKVTSGTINVVSDIDRMKDDLLKDITPGLNRLKTVSKRYLDKIEGVLPKSIHDKLNDILTVEKRSSGPSEEELRNEAISNHISEIFGKQTELQQEQFVQDKTDRYIEGKIEEGRFKDSITVMTQIRNIAKSQQVFFQTEFRQYLMKSLELKYRSIYIAQDTFKGLQSLASIVESKLTALVHNSALPDIQKQEMSEEFMAKNREKLYGKISGTMQEWYQNYGSNIMKNVKENVFDKAKDVINQATDMGSDVLEGLADAKEMEEEFGEEGPNFITSKLAALTKSLLIDTGLVSAKTLIGVNKAKNINDIFTNFTDNLPFMVEDYFDEKAETSGVARFIRDNILPKKEEPSLTNVLKDQATAAVSFDVLTRRSIVEIIPGFLAKILQKSSELASMSREYFSSKINLTTKEPEELVFDVDSEDYVSASTFRQNRLDKLFGTKEERTSQYETIVSNLVSGYKAKGGEEDVLEENLPYIVTAFNNLANSKKVIKPKIVLKYLKGEDVSNAEKQYLDIIFRDIPEEHRDKVAEIFKTTLFSELEDGSYEEDAGITKDLNSTIRELIFRQDRLAEKLPELNVTGGKRYLQGLLGNISPEELAAYKEKLELEAIEKYGRKRFDSDAAIRKEIYDKIVAKQTGKTISQEFIRKQFRDTYDIGVSENTSLTERYRSESEGRRKEEEADLSDKFGDALYSTLQERVGDKVADKVASILNKVEEKEDQRSSIYDTDIDKITEETDIPSRDAVQVSGPGVYFQGADKELHIPYDEASTFFSKFSKSILSAVEDKKAKVKEQIMSGKEKLTDLRSERLDDDDASFWETATDAFKNTFAQPKETVKADDLSSSDLLTNIDTTTTDIKDILTNMLNTHEDYYSNALGLMSEHSALLKASLGDEDTRKAILLKFPEFKPIQRIKKLGKSVLKLGKIPFTIAGKIQKQVIALGKKMKDKLNPVDLIKKYLGFTGDIAAKGLKFGKDLTFGGLKLGAKGLGKVKDFAFGFEGGKIQDIYIKGSIKLGSPAIKAQDILDGKIFDIDGKVVTSVWNIKKPLIDEHGNILISNTDLRKGLVTASGKKLTTKRLLNKAGSLAMSGAKKMISNTFGMVKKGFSMGKDILAGGASLLGGLIAKPFDKLTNWLKSSSPSSLTEKDLLIQKLNSIIDLITPISESFAGPREGSYRDHIRDKKAEEEEISVFDKLKAKKTASKKASLLSGLGGFLGKKKDEDGEDGIVESTVKAAGGAWLMGKAAPILGKVKGLGSKILGKGALGSAARTVGSLGARALGTLGLGSLGAGTAAAAGAEAAAVGGSAVASGGGLLALASNPIGWAVAAGLAVAGGGYYLYSRSKRKKLRAKISDLNNNFYKITTVSGSDITEFEDKVYEITKEHKDFPSDREFLGLAKLLKYTDSMEAFRSWFSHRFLPVFNISVSLIEDSFHQKFTKSYKIKEEHLDTYKEALWEAVSRIDALKKAPPFVPLKEDVLEPKPLEIPDEPSTTDKVKEKVAKVLNKPENKEPPLHETLAPVDANIMEGDKINKLKKVAKFLIDPTGLGRTLFHKLTGPSKFDKARMKLYKIPGNRVKQGLTIEQEVHRKIKNKTKIGRTFIEATAKELGFDITITEQVAYVHTWLQHVFTPLFLLVESILKANDYSFEKIDSIPEKLETHILRHMEKASSDLKEYKDFEPTLAGYLKFTSTPAKERKIEIDVPEGAAIPSTGATVTKALTGKTVTDNFRKSLEQPKKEEKVQPIEAPVIKKVAKNVEKPVSKSWIEVEKTKVQETPKTETPKEDTKPILEDQLSTLDKIHLALEGIRDNTSKIDKLKSEEPKETDHQSSFFNKSSEDIQKDLIKSIHDLIKTLGGEDKGATSFDKFFGNPMVAKKTDNTLNTSKQQVSFQ